MLGYALSQGVQLPVVLVYLIGLGFAIARRGILGDAAAFAGVGFGALALARIASLIATAWQMYAYRGGSGASEIAANLGLIYGAVRLVELVGAVLLVVGLTRRPERLMATAEGSHGNTSRWPQ